MRTTITIDDKLLKKAKLKSLELDISVSKYFELLVSHDVKEDLEDAKTIKQRLNEPELSFAKLKKQLETEGLI